MCGIIGILGDRPVEPLLLDALRRLEYRGYDSAGMATLVNGRIERRRAEGKLARLEAVLKDKPLTGTVGIGHTRWATHGRPSEKNAHPIATEQVAVVHNGIIENFAELRQELQKEGCIFTTDTDTECVAHLVSLNLRRQMTPREAVGQALRRLRGAFALAIVFAGRHDIMVGARRGSPLAVGFGDGEFFIGSDALALAPLTDRICYLEEGDWVVLTPDGAAVFDETDQLVERPVVRTALSGAMIGKAGYRHFMQKEIWEQPAVVGDTLRSLLDTLAFRTTLPGLPFDPYDLPRLTVSACGTAFYAGLVAKYWMEQMARLPVEADIASELRYREAPLPEGGAALFVSQSGETIDTLGALRYAKSQGQSIISVVNQPESAIARASDLVIPTQAGPEIGVASTKAFTTQLTVLACLTLEFARRRKTLDSDEITGFAKALTDVPALLASVLQHDEAIRDLAETLVQTRDVLYLGRGTMYPVALEGALKLKEISYIHAEGYAAGEMKHGPIALIAEDVPVIVCAPSGPLFEKTASNVQEVIARGGRLVLLSDARGHDYIADGVAHRIVMPTVDPFVAPILYAVPVQLLAYHTAVLRGTDVDQPRNLAKSVTVE